ncbi:MAG: glycine cleavage system protein R [Gammaproteobacteria bacterium]|nr:glycine cleavage system protein R [Gammaproteobacteria bacterium]
MSDKKKSQFLVISALGSDRPGIVDELTRPIQETGGNILDSRMTVLGGEFAALLLVEGGWDTIARLEKILPKLTPKLQVMTKRTEEQEEKESALPYIVNVVALDHPGIVNQLAAFFAKREINIYNLETDSYHAPHTGSLMFSANLTVSITASFSIVQLRSEFLEFCDSLNLDAIFEPMKG